MTKQPDRLREAVESALLVHDAAMEMNRESGFDMFDRESRATAFIAGLEAQDPPFTVAALHVTDAALTTALVEDVETWRREHPDLPWAPRSEHVAALHVTGTSRDAMRELLAAYLCDGPTNPKPWKDRSEFERQVSGFRGQADRVLRELDRGWQALVANTDTPSHEPSCQEGARLERQRIYMALVDRLWGCDADANAVLDIVENPEDEEADHE